MSEPATLNRAPKVMVLRAPGINCERECHSAFQHAGGSPEYVHLHGLLEDPSRLDHYRILMVPGGFSFGDDIAAGAVLGHELRTEMGEALAAFVDRGGLVLGICNGFQTLVRLGLLPRTEGGAPTQEVALTWNRVGHYVCRWVTLEVPKNRCVFLEEGQRVRYPAAHAEGRLVTQLPGGLKGLAEAGHVAFRYVDPGSEGNFASAWPANPNGTELGIAGLTDPSGRVLGLMPHPDRAWLAHHMPDWHRHAALGKAPQAGDGMALFASMVRIAKAEG